MLTMLLAVIFMTTSCNKDADEPTMSQAEVSFSISNLSMTDNPLKSGGLDPETPECSEEPPAYVVVTINGMDYRLNVLQDLNDGLETEVLKMYTGMYNVTDFKVYDANDNLIWLSPKGEDGFGHWLENNVEFEFEIVEWKKVKVVVDVLCFIPEEVTEFGYGWFELVPNIDKPLCFYGNICTKFYEDFHDERIPNNPYVGQEYDGYDFPALLEVIVYGPDGQVMDIANNVDTQGDNFCARYLDILADEGEQYTFELFLIEPDNTRLLIHSGVFDDSMWSNNGDGPWASPNPFGGEDGKFDVIIGNCLSDDSPLQPDVILPGYIPLPETVTFKLHLGATSFLDLEVFSTTGGGSLNQIKPGVIPGWCGDRSTTIYIGSTYTADVYTSLDLAGMPLKYQGYGAAKWAMLNWLINQDLSGYTRDEIQNAIWNIIDGTADPDGGLSAAAAPHIDFMPQPGQYAFVLLDPHEFKDQEFQLIIVQVDP